MIEKFRRYSFPNSFFLFFFLLSISYRSFRQTDRELVAFENASHDSNSRNRSIFERVALIRWTGHFISEREQVRFFFFQWKLRLKKSFLYYLVEPSVLSFLLPLIERNNHGIGILLVTRDEGFSRLFYPSFPLKISFLSLSLFFSQLFGLIFLFQRGIFLFHSTTRRIFNSYAMDEL